ncbi:MAG: class I SAM-dependent methyltransferase [Nocardioidaceae bacterium]|nr:class I SAM-dependent methyltransferase [Nocardioidaceae bacterium]
MEVAVWLAGDDLAVVLDLAAGSGQLTTPLASLGHRVVAADLSASMLVQLREVAAALAHSTAEQLPFRSAAFDVVTVATAFHWFDESRALPEIARLLRPSGWFGLVWNTREVDTAWAQALDELLRSAQPAVHRRLGHRLGQTAVPFAFLRGVGLCRVPPLPAPQPVRPDRTCGLTVLRRGAACRSARTTARRGGRLYEERAQSSYPLELTYRAQCWRTRRLADDAALISSLPDLKAESSNIVTTVETERFGR